MYSVVAHNADPYLELDAPALFSNHRDALRYAVDTAIVFRSAEGRAVANGGLVLGGRVLRQKRGGRLNDYVEICCAKIRACVERSLSNPSNLPRPLWRGIFFGVVIMLLGAPR